MNLTIAEEDYIKGIYHLQQENSVVTTNLLANELQTKPASVTDMMLKLQSKNLIDYERYKGFKLNINGNKVALNIIRRHRLWEYFLVNKLGFAWDEVHPIAEELEHVSSTTLIDKLDKYLEHPQIDPHGDPIPDEKGKIIEIKQISLFDIEEGKMVTVSSVSNQTPEMLELLRHYKIGIGTALKITKRFEFDGSLELTISKKNTCIISGLVAKNIFVHHG